MYKLSLAQTALIKLNLWIFGPFGDSREPTCVGR